MGLKLPDSWNRSFSTLLTCSTVLLLCQFVTIQAYEPPQSIPYSVLEYPNNSTVSEQPPPAAVAVSAGNGTSRADRLLNIFTIVKFPNEACWTGDALRAGVCYTQRECRERGGTPSGHCATGFGVCCVFARTCGQSTKENCTYFTSPREARYVPHQGPVMNCQLQVYKGGWDVCQLRLDFLHFDLGPPDPWSGQCNKDAFLVTGSAYSPPVICGKNTGQHMYIDLGGHNYGPITLTVTTSGYHKDPGWDIKITQVRCCDRAPDGCLQYHYGVSGVLKSFNFDGWDQHLANQWYTICVRMEAGFCAIKYEECDPEKGTFRISRDDKKAQTDGDCLNPKKAGSSDHILIPCGTTDGNKIQSGKKKGVPCANRFCGTIFCSLDKKAKAPCPVESHTKPFTVRVCFDDDEYSKKETENVGFCLRYTQLPCSSHK
jgi:hypothetical protein